jgi:eukaryotic-like serine/threonine-protein kinase
LNRTSSAKCSSAPPRARNCDQLLDGLSAEKLNAAQIQEDWDGRLLYEAGRLALFDGQYDKALPALQQAAAIIAAIIAAKNPDGHISQTSLKRLIIEAGRSHRTSTT